MSSCEQVQELISRMLDEELTPQELAMLERHRQSCPDCAAIYAAFHSLSVALSEGLEEAPVSLCENVMAELRRDEIRRKNRRARPWRGVLTAAACVLLFLGITRFVNPALRANEVSAKSAPQSVLAADYAAVTADRGAGVMEAAEAEEDENGSVNTMLTAEEAVGSTAASAAMDTARFLADAADSETTVFDLSDTTTIEDLLAFLEGESVRLAPDRVVDTPAYTLIASDSSLDLYLYEGRLYYFDPASRQAMRSDRSVESLLEFVQK